MTRTLAPVRGLLVFAAVVALAGCGGSSQSDAPKSLLVAVNAPFSVTPFTGETVARGTELGVATWGQNVTVGDETYQLRVKRYDNALSPQRAVANVRRAIADGAVAIVDEGTGVDASWQVANDAGVPIGIVYQGGVGLVEPEERPNVYRIAPTDHGIAFRLAEYLIPKGLKIAILTDDSGYGQQGSRALEEAFKANPEAVATKETLPANARDLAPQVLRARRSGATALLVWAQPPAIAAVLTAARTAGWDVPVYTSPSVEDPLVRQQLADRPEWLDGLTFASGRMTAEVGPGPFMTFAQSFERTYGPQKVGVRTPDGKEIVQPPDYAMYGYDFVHVLVAALQAAGDLDGVVPALEQVTVEGANGDERGFNEDNHEGVVDDDVYFARFEGMMFRPVRDDLLSASLPMIPQTG